jgi:hypothetical protein
VAHALAFAATLGLQAQAGCPVTFSRAPPDLRALAVPGRRRVLRRGGRPAGAGARAAPLSAPRDRGRAFDLPARWRAPAARARRGRAPRPSTGSIVHAAAARGIPFRRLTEGSLVQFGWGSQAAPHPGRRGRPHQRHRRIHRPGQAAHQASAGRRRRAGAEGRPVRDARRRLGRHAGNRRAGGGQAAGRQPGQGRHGQHHHARALWSLRLPAAPRSARR